MEKLENTRFCQSCGQPLPGRPLAGRHRSRRHKKLGLLHLLLSKRCVHRRLDDRRNDRPVQPVSNEGAPGDDRGEARGHMEKFFPMLKRWAQK